MYTTLVAAKEAGTIGTRNRKMPGTAFALPPSKCVTGGKLMGVEGSICHKCYADKSERMYPSVRKGWGENYLRATRMIEDAPDRWAAAMAFQISHFAGKFDEPFHRWFDAGDLASVAMLRAIVRVCELTPTIKHWLPTREAAIVKAWRAAGGLEPANLVIRVSSTMIGDGPRAAANTSTVHRAGESFVGHACPSHELANRAYSPDGSPNCGACRACWDSSVANVSYELH